MASFSIAPAGILLAVLLVLVEGSCDSTCPDCPCFSQTSHTLSVPANIFPGTYFATLTATSPLGLPVTYSHSGSASFYIHPNTGALSTRAPLNSAPSTTYSLSIRGSDSQNVGSTTVTINVVPTGTAGSLLVCTETVLNAQVLEGTTGTEHRLPICFNEDGSVVSDSQLNSAILSSGTPGTGSFALATHSSLTNSIPLDYESNAVYTVNVNLTNSDSPPHSIIISVIINVQPVNEFPPVFSADPVVLEVPESQPLGSVLRAGLATDQDRGGGDGTITYSLMAQQDGDPVLVVSPSSGEIILVSSLDYETSPSLDYVVVASDNPSDISTTRTANASLVVNVVDVNDNPPYFSQAAYSVPVPESAEDMSLVTTLTCVDPDTINSALLFSIFDGNMANKFVIDAASGEIRLRTRIDYDDPMSVTLYTLKVVCQEVAQPRSSAESLVIIEITSVNEFRPDPGNTYQLRLPEDTPPGTMILEVRGRDRDRGPAGELRYFLFESRSGTLPCPDSLYIHNTTGAVYLVAPLDYEREPRNFHCVVSVWDSQTPIRISEQDILVQVVDVNDAPPTCNEYPYRIQVPENTAVGSEIINLNCTDPDSQVLSYEFSDQSGSLFGVDAQGVITLSAELDYETQVLHVIHVQVSDQEFSVQTLVFITVTNINEHTPIFYSLPSCVVSEDAPQGSPLCTFVATDNDQGQDGVVRYSIVTTGTPFDIQSESGTVFVTGELDAEVASMYAIEVLAEDHGTPPRSQSAHVNIHVSDVNDNSPVMAGINYVTVPENSPTGAAVTTLTCTDADISADNSDIQFQVEGTSQHPGDGTLVPVTSPVFAVDPSTGEVTLVEMLDFESIRLYEMSITCRDEGSPALATSGLLHIQVGPINEFPPVFNPTTYSATIPEDVSLGTSVLTVTATDQDAGIHGDILYSIDASGTGSSSLFWVHPQTGVVSVIRHPQCDESTLYSFRVVASDGATPPRQVQAEVTVTVDECHLGTLTPASTIYTVGVVENVPSGYHVVAVSCSSSRSPGVTPSYHLMQQTSNSFEVDRTSGQLRVLSPPDYEEFPSHLLDVQCYDPNHADVFADMAVHISIEPVNEHAPSFSQTEYEWRTEENTPLGARIGTVHAIDADSSSDGDIYYEVVTGSNIVLVDGSSGEVFLTGDLDRETQEMVIFTVMARDNPAREGDVLSATVTVTITLLDINDNWPVCSKTVYHVSLSPVAKPPSILLSGLSCTDADMGMNSDLQYSLRASSSSSSSSTGKFSVNSGTGALTLKQPLHPEDAVAYNVPVLVSDRGMEPYSVMLLVIVDLRRPAPEIPTGQEGGAEYGSLVEEEGKQNAVSIVLPDFSKAIWEERMATMDSFHEAVARSVTNFCALYPEACSLVYGCANFYGYNSGTPTSRRKRQTDQSVNYASFIQPHVVILTNMTFDLNPNLGSVTQQSLEVWFYVRLPDQAELSPYRATNYVVPRSTLTQIVSQDGDVISAVVRSSATPSLTERIPNGWRVAAIVVAAILSVGMFIALVVTSVLLAYKFQARKKTRVSPFKPPKPILSSPKVSTTSTKTASSTGAVIGGVANKQTKIPSHLAHFFATADPATSGPDSGSHDGSHEHGSCDYGSCGSGSSRKSSSNSSSNMTNASMENHTSRRGSTSFHRESDEDLRVHKNKMEDFEDICEDDGVLEEAVEEEVPFPYTWPVKDVKPPPRNLWSIQQ